VNKHTHNIFYYRHEHIMCGWFISVSFSNALRVLLYTRCCCYNLLFYLSVRGDFFFTGSSPGQIRVLKVPIFAGRRTAGIDDFRWVGTIDSHHFFFFIFFIPRKYSFIILYRCVFLKCRIYTRLYNPRNFENIFELLILFCRLCSGPRNIENLIRNSNIFFFLFLINLNVSACRTCYYKFEICFQHLNPAFSTGWIFLPLSGTFVLKVFCCQSCQHMLLISYNLNRSLPLIA